MKLSRRQGANSSGGYCKIRRSCFFRGKVGNDVFGNELLDALKKETVDISAIQRSSEESGTAFITVFEETSQNQIIVILGANAVVNSDQVTEETLISSRS